MVEIMLNVDGEPAAKYAAKREIVWFLCSLFFYVGAAIVAGVEFYSNSGGNSGYPSEYGDYDDPYYGDSYYGGDNSTVYEDGNYTAAYNTTDAYSDASDQNRVLAGATASSSSYANPENDLPAWLCLFGALSSIVAAILMVTFFMPGGGRHKE